MTSSKPSSQVYKELPAVGWFCTWH